MTRKQWINHITDEEALKIHRTFRQIDRGLFALPIMPSSKEKDLKNITQAEFDAARRKAVRLFLRKNHLTKKDLNVQYGRLAAGLNLNFVTK
jgi:hypothetical protein